MNRQIIRSLGAGMFGLRSISAMPWVVLAGVTLITATARGQGVLQVAPWYEGTTSISVPTLSLSFGDGWPGSYDVGGSGSLLYGVGYVNDYVPPSP